MHVSTKSEGFSLNDLQRRNWNRMEARIERRMQRFPDARLNATFLRDAKRKQFEVRLHLQFTRHRVVTGKTGRTLTQSMDGATDALIRSVNGIVAKLRNRPGYREAAEKRRRTSA